jgi:EAL domain-containing protein (putative c-di-GMP-specific phosphodiesterase class I)
VQSERWLEIQVFAKGIESQERPDYLAPLRVDTGHGCFFWPPPDRPAVIPAQFDSGAIARNLVDTAR